MTRSLKVLSVSVAAVLAFSAIAVASASAANFKGTEGDSLMGVANETQVFTTDVGTVECKKLNATGTVAAEEASEQATSSVEYTECEAFGFEAEINFNGCNYNFHAGEYAEKEGMGNSVGTADVICPAGQEIEINAAGLCTVTVGPQNGLGEIAFTNGTDPKTGFEDVTIIPNVTNIAYAWSGFLCGSGSNTNGTYTGAATVTSPQGHVTVVP